MNNVVIFGSGHVARPAIRTLLDSGHLVTVATDEPEAARAMIGKHPQGQVREVDASDPGDLRAAVRGADAALSLLPVTFHVRVAEACVAERVSCVTTSYVSEEMRSLDGLARRRGLLFLNEVGADPGIDHMQAMRLIDAVRAEGGRVTGFRSVCGGLPAPEAADNPLKYKLSWTPRGVVTAGGRRARYLENGTLVPVPAFRIFEHAALIETAEFGPMESIPNGDSLRYLDEYGLEDVSTLFRGTLRWPGWSRTWTCLTALGYLDDAPDAALANATYAVEMWHAAGGREAESSRTAAARALALDPSDPVLESLAWLGLFEDEPVPASTRSRMDLLVRRMEERLAYAPGERDMLVLQHELEWTDARERPRRTRAELTEYGSPSGDTAMSRTVGLPSACAVRRILDGTIRETGVRIPTARSIYEPILNDLDTHGIRETVTEETPAA
ncbi:MAG TPA: saccharopine dehydrogenase C-terminal domain-containing protein [bacterium]|nr:saccharopine dehydrogenase C-terminal domain-containing protein [bacterium]